VSINGREGIPDERIIRRAERLGIEATDILLDKVDVCIGIVREWHSKRNEPDKK
jgi:hypothetical protein